MLLCLYALTVAVSLTHYSSPKSIWVCAVCKLHTHILLQGSPHYCCLIFLTEAFQLKIEQNFRFKMTFKALNSPRSLNTFQSSYGLKAPLFHSCIETLCGTKTCFKTGGDLSFLILDCCIGHF